MWVRAALACVLLAWSAASARAEIFVRWDAAAIPPPAALDLSAVVIPASNRAAVRSAREQGYRVFLEVEGAALSTFTLPFAPGLAGIVVKGEPAAAALTRLGRELAARGARLLTIDQGGKWPHIRSNVVTRRDEVLQVSGRSAQPWLENNVALIRIAAASAGKVPVLAYPWNAPAAAAALDQPPSVDDYLLAVAEAGSFGADLILPLHDQFQQALLRGHPRARAEWTAIRRAIEFHAWPSPRQYRPIANVAVLATEPMMWFEVLNLFARHNLPFAILDPRLSNGALSGFDLVFAPEPLSAWQRTAIDGFVRQGGTAVLGSPAPELASSAVAQPNQTEHRRTYGFGGGRVIEVLTGFADPDAFAREVRQLLGPERRVIDIWNGITVLAAPYRDESTRTALITLVNYAAHPVSLQLRIRGRYSVIHYESPDEPATLVPYEHRDGFTEFVLPSVRVGGRVFLQRSPEEFGIH